MLGPGVEAEAGLVNFAPTYTYAFDQGVMIKGGITGSLMEHEKKANAKFYGAEKSPGEIVMEPGAVAVPEGNQYIDEFYKKLATLNEK